MTIVARITSLFLAAHLLVATSGVPVVWRFCGGEVTSVVPALTAALADEPSGEEQNVTASCCEEAGEEENNAGEKNACAESVNKPCATLCPFETTEECCYHEELHIERLSADCLQPETRSTALETPYVVVALSVGAVEPQAQQTALAASASYARQSLPPPDIPIRFRSLLI